MWLPHVFEIAVNHRGIIVSATKGFYGSVSDKSMGNDGYEKWTL
jgi:hypothetical protein